MPSASLLRWQTDRTPRLQEVETLCATATTLTPPNPLLAEESLRGYVMLLSGHFQGFCRDLYTECVQVVIANVDLRLQPTIQLQLTTEMKLNSSNPTAETIRKDFQRFAFPLDFTTDPANAPRITHLGHLNKWRNSVAHQATVAPIGVPPLSIPEVQSWRISCTELALWLDGMV